MIRINKVFILLIIIFLSILNHQKILAQIVETNALFLTFKPGARANAMGGAQTAIANDFFSAYYNPAGLVNAKRLMIGFNKVEWIADLKHTYTGVILQTPWGSVGFGLNNFDLGRFTVFDPLGNFLGFRSDAFERAWQISYAKSLSKELSLGLNVKYVQEHFSAISSFNSSAWTFDLGILLQNLWPETTLFYRNPDLPATLRKFDGPETRGFSFGIAILNSGPDKFVFGGDTLRVITGDDTTIAVVQETKSPFPQLLRVGFAYRPVDTDELGVLIALDVQKVLVRSRNGKNDPFYTAFFTAWGQDGLDNLYFGAEIELFHVFAFRFGQESRFSVPTETGKKTKSEWTFGFGLGPEWARLNLVRRGFPPFSREKWVYLDFSLNY
jgi:hypothetical protein